MTFMMMHQKLQSSTTLSIYVVATSKPLNLTEQARLLTSSGNYCLSLTLAIPLCGGEGGKSAAWAMLI